MSERACALDGCTGDMSQTRPHAKYCTRKCRAEASRRRAGKPPRGLPDEATCQGPGCTESLSGRRRGTRYHNDTCKRAAERRRASQTPRGPGQGNAPQEGHASAPNQRPRASRLSPAPCSPTITPPVPGTAWGRPSLAAAEASVATPTTDAIPAPRIPPAEQAQLAALAATLIRDWRAAQRKATA
jgi:hypothetical protein